MKNNRYISALVRFMDGEVSFEPKVKEEQQRREDDRLFPRRHHPGQAHHAHVAQRHHQRAGNSQRRLQAPAQQIERGAQAVHQERVA